MLAKQKPDPWEPPCLIEGVSFSDYLEIPAASSHALGTLLTKSPMHVKEDTDTPSGAMALGTVAHALLLEYDSSSKQIAVKPAGASKRSNSSKRILLNWLTEATGAISTAGADMAEGEMLSARIAELEPAIAAMDVTVCTQEQYDTAQRMRDSVLAKDIGRVIFADGRAEVTLLAVDPPTGVLCKGRADWLPDGHHVIVDFKTAASASFEDFARACGRYGYHSQAAFYRGLYSLVTGSKRPSFLHVVVESEPPFDCAFYELDSDALEAGEKRIRRALEIWKRCEESAHWPGIGYDFCTNEYTIQQLSLPRWAL